MRRLAAARGHGGLHGLYPEAAARLRPEAASLNDSYALLPDLYRCDVLPEPLCYQGDLFPERAEAVLAARLERDRRALSEALSVLLARVRKDLQPPRRRG